MKSEILPPEGGFQGDIRIIPIRELPSGLRAVPAAQNGHVVAHSETGHHHTVDPAFAEYFRPETDTNGTGLVGYLDVQAAVELRHHREHDQHQSITLPTGTYRIIRQRESAPGGWRMAAD